MRPTLLSATAAGLLLAACGGTAPKPGGSTGTNSQFAVARCMRLHGVPNFPDPTKGPGGEGFSISARPGSSTLTVDGITFSGPAFTSAEETCKLFGGGTAPPAISEHQKLQLLAFAKCMRQHGVPNFSDPTFPPGGGIEQGADTGVNRSSPAVRDAAQTCNRITRQ